MSIKDWLYDHDVVCILLAIAVGTLGITAILWIGKKSSRRSWLKNEVE